MGTIGQVQEAKDVKNAREFGEQVGRQVGDAIGLLGQCQAVSYGLDRPCYLSPDMLVAVLLKHPIEIGLVVLWQQRPTTRTN